MTDWWALALTALWTGLTVVLMLSFQEMERWR